MEFGLLGTVIATGGGRILELGRRRERLLLALLLLDVGKPIATDRLIDLLWGQDLPRDPRSAIHVHISRIRRRLSVANSARYGVGVVSVPGGYAIHAEAGSVDVHRFVSQVADARVIADAAARTEMLGAALALWRGEALADVAPGWLRQRICPQLEELRLTALELRIEADLELRRHTELIPELAALVREHPARERLIALWMLALYRGGRQQDALAAYGQTAKLLAEEFGLDPGSDLRELRTSILRDDPGLTPRQSHSPSFSPGGSRPAQLPAEASTFVGRDAELAALLAMLDMRPANPASGPVLTIDGMAGIGKTAFALHAARHLDAAIRTGRCSWTCAGSPKVSRPPIRTLRSAGS
jgi:DNA-binding SARP family transcriptional activator